jgi:hypothetical protein
LRDKIIITRGANFGRNTATPDPFAAENRLDDVEDGQVQCLRRAGVTPAPNCK